MRSNICIKSKTNISANIINPFQRNKKPSEVRSICCPLVSEKIVQILPISLKSTYKTKSVTKENDLKNLYTSKSKSYIENTKDSIASHSSNTILKRHLNLVSDKSNEDDLLSNDALSNNEDTKNISFLSNIKNTTHSRMSSTIKSDNGIRKRHHLFENNSIIIKNDFMTKNDTVVSYNDDSISTHSEGNVFLDDFFILEEKLAFIKTVYFIYLGIEKGEEFIFFM